MNHHKQMTHDQELMSTAKAVLISSYPATGH